MANSELDSTCISQYVYRVVNFSSQYGRADSTSYTVQNVIGNCKSYPSYGDFNTSLVLRTYGPWWQRAPMASLPLKKQCYSVKSQDFIEVSFETQVYPQKIEIYETFNPGCIVRIFACNCNAESEIKSGEVIWKLLWAGPPQSKDLPKSSRNFSPKLNNISFPTNLLRIEFNCEDSDYYTEIDAIMLSGVTSNKQISKSDRSLGFNIEQTTKMLEEVSISELKQQTLSHVTSENSKCIPDMLLLPNEVLVRILSVLEFRDIASCARTCKRLLYVSYDNSLYREVDLQPFWITLDNLALNSLQIRCKHIVKVSFNWTGAGGQITEDALLRFFEQCGNTLEVIRLNCCHFITRSTLHLISEVCQNLQEIELQACVQLNVNDFSPLAKLKSLRKINLYRCSILEEILINIIRNCPNLEYLNLGATNADFQNTKLDINKICEELAKNCPHLKALDLWRTNVASKGIKELQNCTQLLELDIGWTIALQDKRGLIDSLKYWPNMKKLFLTTSRNSDHELIRGIYRFMPNIEQLDILGSSSITVECIEELLSRSKCMYFLDVSFCAGFTEEVVDILRQKYVRVTIKRSFQ